MPRCRAPCWLIASTHLPDRSLSLHNLADTAVTIDIGPLSGMDGTPYDLFVDGPYAAPTKKLTGLDLNGWGYRWIRLSRSDQR